MKKQVKKQEIKMTAFRQEGDPSDCKSTVRISGLGNIDYICDNCNSVLMENILQNSMSGTFRVYCCRCGLTNEIDFPAVKSTNK
ncbi:hypothetical protein OI18_06530 [Flavihumibacter solisilvae]|uniref:Uncharacterized protein n=1 Tax=Flavihumibacter solisilvae TaxID=1349421 RepID=A0A0C1L6X4_9BACT|nr:hypothetical protein OI18_06530 [Flavihumibacter solisilvae]